MPLVRFMLMPLPVRTLMPLTPMRMRTMRMAVAAGKRAVRQPHIDFDRGCSFCCRPKLGVSTHASPGRQGTGSSSGHACLGTRTNAS